jgi:hypothetical protein
MAMSSKRLLGSQRDFMCSDCRPVARSNFRVARDPPRIRNQPIRVVSVIAV